MLILVSMLVFTVLQLAPGDPASLLLPETATDADRAMVRERWGLDQPIFVQYLQFIGHALQGDLGNSFQLGQPVVDIVASRLPATIELSVAAILIAIAIAIPIGVIAGARPNSATDNAGTAAGLFAVSLPSFWFGIMLILLFAGLLHIFPSGGRTTYGIAGESITGFYTIDSLIQGNWAGLLDALSHLALPALTLGTALAGILMRITRSAVLEVTREDFVTVARSKGLGNRAVLWRHVLRNAMIPIVTVVGLELGGLISGSIITETVFAWPGIGRLLITAVNSRDYPLVTGIILIYTLIFMLINLVVDIVYAVVDPRIRY